MNMREGHMRTDQNTAPRPGYKLTKLGWIPEEWEVVLLEKAAKRGSGHTPDKKEFDYYNGGIKWISLADSYRLDKGLVFDSEIEVSEKGIANSSAVVHPKGTVLMSRDAGVGKSGIMAIPMAVSQHFITWKCGPSLENWFLYYWLQHKKSYFERQAVGSTIKTIGLPFFKKLPLPLPPLAEQRKIAAILSTWDQAIAQTEALLAQLRQRNRGLAQQLLTGETRVRGVEGKWEEVRLGEIAERVNRKNAELNDNVVTISAQRGFVRQEEFFNKRIASEELQGYLLLKKGEFAYNKSYSNGYPMGAFKRLDDYEKAVVTTLYICFRLKTGTDPDFLLQYFEAGRIVKGLMRIAQEGGRAHGLLNISLEDFFNLKLIMPPLPEQQAIARILQAADAEVAAQEARLTALREQKRGLMQGLLTGAVRTSNT